MKRYDTVCTVCGARDLLPFGQRTDGIRVLQCAVCGHGIVEQFQDDVGSLYGDEYFSATAGSAVGYEDYDSAAERGVAWAASLLRLLKPGGKVLDIGCANGHALQLLGKGYDCFGIELNAHMAYRASQAGVQMIARDLLDADVEQSYTGFFDAVLAIAVFEHVPDFKESFRIATALLKPDGLLIFEVPAVQLAGDIWYRSSLEHLHYPTGSSIEYLFREILHLPLAGGVVDVQDFGGIYIGLTSPGAEAAHRAGREYDRLTTADPTRLRGDEARFRWHLDLMHSARSGPDTLGLHRHLKPEDLTAPALHRLFELWAYREEKLQHLQAGLRESESRAIHALEDSAQAKTWLEEQVRNWQQVAEHRQAALEDSAQARTWLEEQVRNWQQVAEHRQAALEDSAQTKTRLEEQIRSWQQAAEQYQADRTAYAASNAALEEQILDRQQTVAKLRQRISELEEAGSLLTQHVEQRSERIAVLEETISRMRATRAWRAAEWSVGVLRRASGIWRSIVLMGSPRRVSSNAKNVLLGLRLVFGDGEGRSAWGARFDADHYRSAYPDVARSGVRPWLHYLLCGYLEDRNPSERFDSAYYRWRYTDVREAGVNPLLHYAVFGRREQRSEAPPSTPATADLSCPAPLVSVVILCGDGGHRAQQTIQSVLSQTFTNFEIIVVAGGSTDETTPETLRGVERNGLPRTRFMYRGEPHPVGDNRNFGIGPARGRYICCLDAGDLIKPNYLEIAVFLAEFFGYDIVYPSVRCFGGSDSCSVLCDATWPEIADCNQISPVAMFRKAAWQEVGGFRDLGAAEGYVPQDWELWVRLVGHGFRAKSIREPLMLQRVHADGSCTTADVTTAHRQAIREANPQLFVNGFVPTPVTPDSRATCWDNLIEPAGSRPSILLALPFITLGGAEKVFETLARSLIGRGHRVLVITTLVLAETIRDCTESFETVTPCLYPLPRLFQNQEDRWKDFLFYLLKRYQVGMILLAGCDFVYGLLPEIAREFPQIAVIDQLFNGEVHYGTNRRHAAYIDATIVPSQKLAHKLISESGEQADSVFVVPHGIAIEESPALNPVFDSGGMPRHFRGKFLVSFFGRLSAEKAPADFIEIARLLRSYDEICFLMTGEGPERAAVLALIERYGLQDRIHAPGFVDDVRTLMALSDVVVVPSTLDGMPLVVFEAQSCGKPVVASTVGSIPHVIADGKTGLLCAPGDIDGFAERILELWRSPEMRRAIGSAARVWVRAHHSAEAMTARYIEAFDQVRSRARRIMATN